MRYRQETQRTPGHYRSVYQGSWVTHHRPTQANIAAIVTAARCRWHIENPCFNHLKNQGYYLEHNYGHGEHYLRFNFMVLTVLAFFLHQVLEYADTHTNYQI